MNRLLNLRPLVRTFRVQKSESCRRYVSRTISTTAARNFNATSSVNKRNTPHVDLDILEGMGPAKGAEGAAESSKATSSMYIRVKTRYIMLKPVYSFAGIAAGSSEANQWYSCAQEILRVMGIRGNGDGFKVLEYVFTMIFKSPG